MFIKQLFSPEEYFYLDDRSSLRFETAYHRIVKSPYPAWSVEAKLVKWIRKNNQYTIKLNAKNCLDGQNHHFYFKKIFDSEGTEWVSFDYLA